MGCRKNPTLPSPKPGREKSGASAQNPSFSLLDFGEGKVGSFFDFTVWEKEPRPGDGDAGDKSRHGMPFAGDGSIMTGNGRYCLQRAPFDFTAIVCVSTGENRGTNRGRTS